MAKESILIDEGIPDSEYSKADPVNGFGDKTVKDVLDSFGNELNEGVKQNLKTRGHQGGAIISSGKLIQAGDYRVFYNGRGYVFEYSFKDAPYWKAVDEGRRPGKFPPQNRLRDWVRGKLAFGQLRVDQNPVPEYVINGLAYVIGRKIAKEGTKPTHFFSDLVTPARLQKLTDDIAKASKNELRIATRMGMQSLATAFKGQTIKIEKGK